MLGLSQSDTLELLQELGFPPGATPSNQEIENQLEKVQKDSKLSNEKLNQIKNNANKLIDQNEAEQKTNFLLNKQASAEATQEKMRINAATSTDATFAAATSFTQQGTITAKRIDHEPVQIDHLSMEDDMMLQKQFNEKLDAMNFSGSKPVIIGASATGFIAGQNIARTQAIQGNMLVRLGSNNEVTEKDLAKVGIGAIEASLKNPDGLMLVVEGFSTKFSNTIAQQAREQGFNAKNISIVPNDTSVIPKAETKDPAQQMQQKPTEPTPLTPFNMKPNPLKDTPS